ncbi:MAG: glycosyltransferase family 4 protein [Alphaproteobacteria bacterium]|nr:glycosyltransferase family 4 protein [Alphaproteobacteria bacterium]
MAAGLPVVVTDWDGFRDTVEHGVTDFLIPTIVGGNGGEIFFRHQMGTDNHASFLRNVAQATAMDIGAAADAYWRLAEDANLRRQMGKAGQARARRMYDWRLSFRNIWRFGRNRRAYAPRPGNSRPWSRAINPCLRVRIPSCCLPNTQLIGLIPRIVSAWCLPHHLNACRHLLPSPAPLRAGRSCHPCGPSG